MKILVVLSTMNPGGAERVALELVRERAARGDHFMLAAPRGRLDAEEQPAGVERWVLPRGGRNPRRILHTAGLLAGAVWRFRPEVIHVHGPRAALTTLLAVGMAGRGRRGLVVTHHGVEPDERRQAARILRAVPRIVCVSADLRTEVVAAGVPDRRIRVIPNGVSAPQSASAADVAALESDLGLPPGRPVVSLVGRLEPQKAVHRFIEAAALVDKASNVVFLIVGGGTLREQLETYARELGLAERLKFTGLRPDARQIIERSSLLVFSSHWEGLSIAALEALVAGVPVISSDVAGMRELLGSGAGSIIEEPTPQQFAQRIADLLADPEQRAEMGNAGTALVKERYSIEAMAAAYAAVYREIADG